MRFTVTVNTQKLHAARPAFKGTRSDWVLYASFCIGALEVDSRPAGEHWFWCKQHKARLPRPRPGSGDTVSGGVKLDRGNWKKHAKVKIEQMGATRKSAGCVGDEAAMRGRTTNNKLNFSPTYRRLRPYLRLYSDSMGAI
jgi:hypothetical protein